MITSIWSVVCYDLLQRYCTPFEDITSIHNNQSLWHLWMAFRCSVVTLTLWWSYPTSIVGSCFTGDHVVGYSRPGRWKSEEGCYILKVLQMNAVKITYIHTCLQSRSCQLNLETNSQYFRLVRLNTHPRPDTFSMVPLYENLTHWSNILNFCRGSVICSGSQILQLHHAEISKKNYVFIFISWICEA